MRPNPRPYGQIYDYTQRLAAALQAFIDTELEVTDPVYWGIQRNIGDLVNSLVESVYTQMQGEDKDDLPYTLDALVCTPVYLINEPDSYEDDWLPVELRNEWEAYQRFIEELPEESDWSKRVKNSVLIQQKSRELYVTIAKYAQANIALLIDRISERASKEVLQ